MPPDAPPTPATTADAASINSVPGCDHPGGAVDESANAADDWCEQCGGPMHHGRGGQPYCPWCDG